MMHGINSQTVYTDTGIGDIRLIQGIIVLPMLCWFIADLNMTINDKFLKTLQNAYFIFLSGRSLIFLAGHQVVEDRSHPVLF